MRRFWSHTIHFAAIAGRQYQRLFQQPSCSQFTGRTARLLRHADFERVYKQGRRHFATHMTVFYLRRAEGQGLRVGFTVGRVLGGAVERNRMKRRLREAARLGFRTAIVPKAHRGGPPDVTGIEVIAVSSLREAITHALTGATEPSDSGSERG